MNWDQTFADSGDVRRPRRKAGDVGAPWRHVATVVAATPGGSPRESSVPGEPSADSMDKSTSARRATVPVSSKGVLVVEDTETSADPLIRLLRYAGHRVHWAQHGKEGLDALDGFKPDLVLLDLMMPVMDGYQFLENLRASARWQHLRVIVLTAMGPAVNDAKLKQLGVESVLIKGALDYHRLLHQIQ